MYKFLILVMLSYAFGIFVQLPLFYDILATPFLWNETLPISIFTPDSGLHGFYAKSIINHAAIPFDAEHFLGYLIAYSSILIGSSIDWVMLLLPMFITPLVVVPIILIGRTLSSIRLGVLASLFVLLYIPFYTRTSIGFTDNDIYILILPLFSIWAMVRFFQTKKLIYSLVIALLLLVFLYIYHSALSVVALLVLTFALMVIIMERKDHRAYQALIVVAVSIAPLPFIPTVLLIGTLCCLFVMFNRRWHTPYYIFIIGILAILLLTPFIIDLSPFVARGIEYLNKPEFYTVDSLGRTYYFEHALKTVVETQTVGISSLTTFSIIGVLNFLSVVGFLLLVRSNRLWLVFIPFVFLGILSFFAGGRFNFYYTPVYGFGLAFFILFLSSWLHKHRGVERIWVYLTLLIIVLSSLYILESNKTRYVRMLAYSEEKALLENFGETLKAEDKVVSWWDFGWPLWYFTGYQNTLSDNGEHGGPDSYLISRILSDSNQTFVANAAKFLANNKKEANAKGYDYILPYMAEQISLQDLFDSFYKGKVEAQQDTYIILHRSMVTIFRTITDFSDYNILDTSLEKESHFKYKYFSFYYTNNITDDFLERHNKVDIGDEAVLVKNITFVKDQKIENIYSFDENSTYHIILENNEMAYMTDENVYNSFLFQALLMDNYDHDLFEKVGETYLIKIFKVK